MSDDEERENLEQLRKILPPGMSAAIGTFESENQDISIEILDGLAKNDFPWDSPPMVVLVHEDEGQLHPAAIIPLIGHMLSGGWKSIGISDLPNYLPPVPPPDPIVALGFVTEIYIGSRLTEDPDRVETIGDEPGDLEARMILVHFAGGGEKRAIHFRESGITASWGKPGENPTAFRTTPDSPQDYAVMGELADLLVRINNP